MRRGGSVTLPNAGDPHCRGGLLTLPKMSAYYGILQSKTNENSRV